MDSLEEGCANRHTELTRQESCGPGGLSGLGGVIVGSKIAKSSSHRVVFAEGGGRGGPSALRAVARFLLPRSHEGGRIVAPFYR